MTNTKRPELPPDYIKNCISCSKRRQEIAKLCEKCHEAKCEVVASQLLEKVGITKKQVIEISERYTKKGARV